jgi:hypothetical protein
LVDRDTEGPGRGAAYLNEHLTDDGEDADELFLIALSFRVP